MTPYAPCIIQAFVLPGICNAICTVGIALEVPFLVISAVSGLNSDIVVAVSPNRQTVLSGDDIGIKIVAEV